ncbi:MAG TPA: DUF4118 domain-containing protein [Phenylobacterium sp.]|nr:DUF4118 domain-containing protein [Phenylobacterium sp.]
MIEPRRLRRETRRRTYSRYAVAVGLVAVANACAYLAGRNLAGANLAMLFLLCVLVSAAAFGIGPALVSAFLAALTYNFFFLEPHYTFRIAHPADLLTFLVFFAVALATGWLAGRARDNERRTAEHAAATTALLDASRALAKTATPDEAAQALAEQIASATSGSAIVLLPGQDGLRLAGAPRGLNALGAGSLEAAEHVWANGEAAPQAERSSEWTFLPLHGVGARVGVVGLRGRLPPRSDDVPDLTSALLEQGGVVIERALLASAASENEALRQADQLRSGLLNSISHDFRTPLTSILGSATTLSDYESELKPSVRRDLLRSIQQDAQRLNQHIGALLDMSRLEGGALRPKQDWTDVREIIGSALRRLGPRLAGRRIERDFAARLSLVRADPTLLEQAILNVLDNAATYTPQGGTIRVAAQEDARNVLIAIEDEGPGIPPDELRSVFDKFKRLRTASDRTGGLGLGLSITKGFVEAMGGRVAAASPLTSAGGARFVISLPKVAETPRGLL